MKVNNDDKKVYFKLFNLWFPWNKTLFLSLLWKIYALAVILLLVSISLGYEMTDADIPGGLIACALLTYLITLLIDES